MESIGLSSYPYLGGFSEPEQPPLDYYTRLVERPPLPLMVIEGGWTSASLGAIVSSTDKQRRYVERHVQLLDAARAIGYFQITVTDLDVADLSLPPGSILPLLRRERAGGREPRAQARAGRLGRHVPPPVPVVDSLPSRRSS